ncbi:riboflavin kinase [Mesoplasma seiffertii]|uniref:riboflavin kinase n=1 Tax=Mesoplasma seiffertii TaxID=28224 RepID=UPI000687DB6A|nr:riboflavin kinase [Mesoplasma seiffertii]
MRNIYYSELTKMLYNMEPSIAIIGDFGNWTDNETNLILEAKQKFPKHNLSMVVDSDKYNIANVISNNVLKAKCEEQQLAYIEYYKTPFDRDWSNFKQDLNIDKVITFDNYAELSSLISVFGEENVITIKWEPNHDQTLKTILTALTTGDLDTYQQLTGHNFTFKGHVEHGNHHGRELGFPTANLLTNNLLKAKYGVYLVKVTLPNEDFTHWGIASFWVNNQQSEVFETHILDFDQDIYGWGIEIELVKYLRENQKVNSIEELKNLINTDKAQALKLIA